jgi:DNA-binding beta-propeller fold protein YncE
MTWGAVADEPILEGAQHESARRGRDVGNRWGVDVSGGKVIATNVRLDPRRVLLIGAALACIASLAAAVLSSSSSIGASERGLWPARHGASLLSQGGGLDSEGIFNVSISSDANTALILGSLTALSPASVATPGSEPISLVISPDGKSAYAGFERGTSVEQFARDTTTGRITPLTPATVQAGIEPRTVAISPDGKSVYATNFNDDETVGGDTISQFSRNTETGTLTAFGSPVPTEAGPHGIQVSPDGKSVYAANYGAKSVSQFSRDPETGALTALSPATVPAGLHPNGIAISFDGRSVYTANRFSDTVSQYSRNAETGLLTALSPATVETGENPHDVAISPDSRSVYVPTAAEGAKTKTLSQFSRDIETGALTALSPATVATAGEARGVTVSSDGMSVYVANGTEGLVSQYGRDPTTGLLAQLSPPAVAAGTHSYSVAVSPDGRSAYVTNEKSNDISQYSRMTPPDPPTVTKSASELTQTSAMLNAAGNPNTTQQQRTPPVPAAKLVSKFLTARPSGTISVKVSCPAGESRCTGTITLRTLTAISVAGRNHSKKRKPAILTLAVGSFTAAGGHVKTVTLRLSANGRKLLARTRVLRARATVLAHNATGATHTARSIVTIRAVRAARPRKA